MQPRIAECRVSQRHSCQVPTACQPAASNELRWAATMEDISLSGVRIRLRRRFEPRSALAIELPGRNGEDASSVYVKVMHVRNQGGGYCTLGCKFMSELSEDELDRLLALSDGTEADEEEGENADVAEHTEPEPRRTLVANLHLWIGAGVGRYVHCRVKRFRIAGTWPAVAGSALKLQGVSAEGLRLDHTFDVVGCAQNADGWCLQMHPFDGDPLPEWVRQRAILRAQPSEILRPALA
jgi:PilZ domain